MQTSLQVQCICIKMENMTKEIITRFKELPKFQIIKICIFNNLIFSIIFLSMFEKTLCNKK